MDRPLYAYRYLTGNPRELEDRLLEGALTALGAPPSADRAVDGSVRVELPAEVVGVSVAKGVRVRTGAARHPDTRTVLPVRWHAEPGGAAFPTFDGAVELQPLDDRRSQLTIAGTYRPPLGVLGGAADAAGLHRVAQRTAEELLDRLADRMTAAEPSPPSSPDRPAGLCVRDVMTANPLVLDPDLPLKTAALIFFHADVSGAPVVAMDGTLVGVLSERDLLVKRAVPRWGLGRDAAEDERRLDAATVGEACSSPALTTVPEAALADVARVMLDSRVGRLVVLDRSRVAGIVTRHDVLGALLREDVDVHAAVGRALHAVAAPGVRATVEWGRVTLTGTVDLRSRAERAVASVAEVDGVLVVEGADLRWEFDDVAAAVARPFL